MTSNSLCITDSEKIEHVIKNLKQARWELENGFIMSCDIYLEYCIGVIEDGIQKDEQDE